MTDYDQQVSESIEHLNKVHKKLDNLAEALVEINKNSHRTYGIATGFKPQRGIYYIEAGRTKPLSNLYDNIDTLTIDKIKNFKLITSEKKNKLKITYANNQTLILE